MDRNKKSYVVIAAVVFIISGFLLLSGIFTLPKSVYRNNPMDYIFLVLISILFWYSASFLFNRIVDSVLWSKLFRIPVGKASFQWIKDFIASIPYTAATAIVLITVFWIEFSGLWMLLLILLLLLQTVMRPRFLSFFPSEAFARVKPFNQGDWIRIKNGAGDVLLVGEVYDINRGSVFIKTEDNNLIFVSMEFLAATLIENYRSFGEHCRFKIDFSFDHTIPAERIKRVLLAAAKQVIAEKGMIKSHEPEVMISGIEAGSVNYELYYWLRPWFENTPAQIKNDIFAAALKNLQRSAISPAYPKRDVFNTEAEPKQTDLHSIEDIKKILGQIEIFEPLNENEIEILAENLKVKPYKYGDAVITEGERGESMFVLVEGLLRVSVRNSEGNNITVASLHAGEFFGEISLFTGEVRTATVTAETDCLVLEITKDSIMPLIKNRVDLVNDFSGFISRRHDINVEKLLASEAKGKSKAEIFIGKIKSFFNLK